MTTDQLRMYDTMDESKVHWRRGERPRARDWGTMFDSLLKLQYSRLFHFERLLRMKARLHGGREDIILLYKYPNGVLHFHNLETRTAAFLFPDGSAALIFVAYEEEKNLHRPP